MASQNDIEMADRYDRRMLKKPIDASYAIDEIYIQYEDDMERIRKQRKDTLGVLRYYRKTVLVPTGRRLIPNNKDLKLLIEMLGLEDIE